MRPSNWEAIDWERSWQGCFAISDNQTDCRSPWCPGLIRCLGEGCNLAIPCEDFAEQEELLNLSIAQMLHEETDLLTGIIQTADIKFVNGMKVSSPLRESPPEEQDDDEYDSEVEQRRLVRRGIRRYKNEPKESEEDVGMGGSSPSGYENPLRSDESKEEELLIGRTEMEEEQYDEGRRGRTRIRH